MMHTDFRCVERQSNSKLTFVQWGAWCEWTKSARTYTAKTDNCWSLL